MDDNKLNSGCYQLVIRMNRDCTIKVGRLGKIPFSRGFYVYTGRSLRGLQRRVRRHLSKKKKLHWHIDYFLTKGRVIKVIYYPGRRDECIINAQGLKRAKEARVIKGFGSSDCRCRGHLIWSREMPYCD